MAERFLVVNSMDHIHQAVAPHLAHASGDETVEMGNPPGKMAA